MFARALRTSTRARGGLLLIGTPADEPWHLAAHLDDESRLSGIAGLAPTLVRWNAPADAPPHLRVGLERLAAPGAAKRCSWSRRIPPPRRCWNGSATPAGSAPRSWRSPRAIPNWMGWLTTRSRVPPGSTSPVSFTVAQHLVSAAAGDRGPHPRRGVRERLAHLLDVVSGPSAG